MNALILSPPPPRQHGMALLIALIMLVVMTLFALSAVRFSSLEIKMSSNDEMIVEAFEKAVSITDATIANPSNTPVTGADGYTVCTANLVSKPGSGCNVFDLALPDGFEAAALAKGQITVKSILKDADKPPPAAIGSSLKLVGAASFQVEGGYDRTADGLGRDQINEGALILYPKSGN